jgi:acyl-CoA synthetase (AMP-forming)/AMP-acid ligase II
MKVSGMQVSPAEIENALLTHPGELINDVVVAGVQMPLKSRGGKQWLSERVPRAWVVLTAKGQRLGDEKVVKELNSWLKQRLSKYKQLRGGIGVVPKVRFSAA